MEDIDFDFILNEIEYIYNQYEIECNKYEIESNAYIKTRQIVPYNYINNTILTAIYCYTNLFNIFLYINNIKIKILKV